MILRRSLIPVMFLGSLVLSGCSAGDAWKSTKALYGEYLNPPASINYDDKGSLSSAESMLASRMVGIDIQLDQLERYLQNSDKAPTGESVMILFQRFPWLSGFAAVNADGTVLAQEPQTSMKELDFSKILAEEPRGGELRGLRGLVQDSPLGAEVLMGIPVFSDATLRGMLVAHFDMRSLLNYTSGADDLVVLAPQGILWSGRFAVEATPLAGRDWADLTRSAAQGSVSSKDGTFIWMVRFIGKQPIVFATPSEGHFAESSAPEQALPQTGGPVTEGQVLEHTGGPSLLLAPLPPVRGLNLHEAPISY